MSKPVILTGLRANSEFHLGNYLGAILPMVELQKAHAGEYQVNMFVPDLHSFTTPIDHGKLYQQTLDNLKLFVAAGLDINNPDTFIYRQSYVPAHSELTWILGCFAYFGELSRMTQFKEKGKDADIDLTNESGPFEGFPHVSAGLFNYPVLMASDILLYGAKWVPVGEDQRQHLELTRDLAIRINNKFEKDIFVIPEPWDKQLKFADRDNGVRIRSLRNPEKKMSKSVEDPAGTILLSDSPNEAAKKIMGATTDSFEDIQYDYQKRPGISNLLDMLSLFGGETDKFIGQQQYGPLKEVVAGKVATFLGNLHAKVADVDEKALHIKLETDEVAMNKVANATLLKVQKAVGLRPQ